MAEAAVTSKGQITIPAEIRRRMGIKPQDRVVFTVLPNGTTVMRAKTRNIGELAQSLNSKFKGRRVPVKDMRMD